MLPLAGVKVLYEVSSRLFLITAIKYKKRQLPLPLFISRLLPTKINLSRFIRNK